MAQTLDKAAYKISFKKIAHAAAAEVRVHKKLVIITLVLYGVAMLLFLFNCELFESHEGMAWFSPSGWGIFFTCLGIAVGYFTALNVFRDMNNQQLCDVSMALPIKSSEHFLSKLLCLFYIQIAPLITATLGGNGIAVLFGVVKYGAFADNVGATRVFQIVLAALAASMFIMAITVLGACCCGATAESAYFSIILMFTINVMPVCFVYNIICKSAGFESINPFTHNEFFDLGYWGFLFMLDGLEEFVPHCIVGCVISLAVMLLSGLVYRKRDARTVGSPISSRVFFEILMFLGCVTVFSLFSMYRSVLWGVLIAAVAYMIINVIVCRAKITPLSFLKWGAKYLVTAGAFTCILVLTIKTGGYGLINSRPAAEHLGKTEFLIYYFDYDPNILYDTNRIELKTGELTAEQADRLMEIWKKHIKQGRADMNALNIISDSAGSSTYVYMAVEGNMSFKDCPSPQAHFAYKDYTERGHLRLGYYVSFRQGLKIPNDEIKAMFDEMRALDFVIFVPKEVDRFTQTSEYFTYA